MAHDRLPNRRPAAKFLALPLVVWLLCGGAPAQAVDLARFYGLFNGYCTSRIFEISNRLLCTGNYIEFNKLLAAVLALQPPSEQANRTALSPSNNPGAAGSGANQNRSGTCAVGHQDAGSGTPYHAFRWTAAGGPVDLGTLDAANNTSRSSDATDVSNDCSVIVGTSQFNANGLQQHAYRWTATNGMVDLGAPAGAGRNSRAFGISAAGDVVVGEGEFADAAAFSGFRTGAFRWTQAGGFQSLGAIEPGFFTSATAVTADGSVIVGNGGVSVTVGNSQTNGSRAFRWTQAAGLVPIVPLAGHQFADAASVSDNGQIVVGTSSTGPLDRNGSGGLLRGSGTAFRWTQATGIQDLRQLLVAAGVDMTGVALLSVTGLSPDGQWITGAATTPTTPAGETVGYIVQYCDAAIGAACSTAAAAPFSVGVTSSALTVAAGQSATTTLTITPTSGFSSAVSLSCAGLPVGASCSFAPASVTPSGGPVSTTLTIGTDGGAVAMLLRESTSTALALLIPFAWLGRGALTRRSRREAWALLAVLAVAAVACGGGGGGSGTGNSLPPATGTPAGTSTVAVTATSGAGATAVSSTLVLTLTVTR